MERSRKTAVQILIACLAVILVFTGFNPASQPAMAQDGTLRNCTLLYAVQPGETLRAIAQRFGVTLNDIYLMNPVLRSSERIIPGLVLCLSEDSDAVLPEEIGSQPPAQPGISVIRVDSGRAVTIQGINFPGNTRFTARMSPYGLANAPSYNVAEFTTPSDGSFVQQFAIPAQIKAATRILIRIENTTLRLAAASVFRNIATSGIPAENCEEFYTVRGGDTLTKIAQRFGIPVQRLIELNDLLDINVIYPGQRLCIAADEDVLPPNGQDAVLRVLDVDPGQEVAVRGRRFPPNVLLAVFIGPAGQGGLRRYNVGQVRTGADGRFEQTFPIPPEFDDIQDLEIRVENLSNGFFVTAGFKNATQ